MGQSFSLSTADVVQTAVNTTYQNARNECSATCNQNISGNVIVLDNTTAGDIQFTQRCEADASCYMNNSLDALVQAFQAAEADADAKPSMFPGLQVNVSKSSTTTDIRNEMTQIMENICKGKVEQNITDNVVYATDSTLGNIGYLQEGNAYARCVMENTGRLKLQMQQKGNATSRAGGTNAIIAAIVAVVIIIILIGVGSRLLKKNSSEQKTGEGADSGQPPPGTSQSALKRPSRPAPSAPTGAARPQSATGSLRSQASNIGSQIRNSFVRGRG